MILADRALLFLSGVEKWNAIPKRTKCRAISNGDARKMREYAPLLSCERRHVVDSSGERRCTLVHRIGDRFPSSIEKLADKMLKDPTWSRDLSKTRPRHPPREVPYLPIALRPSGMGTSAISEMYWQISSNDMAPDHRLPRRQNQNSDDESI
ncbi:hypothetical protein AXG93_3522s1140 [Marchantia polymorpha subsp. ruderalis]|uniref:Uncharacterized protein n=1 Tax=Marchantia polymorpha subsp. ruderalis TaxID=1480154 RepID=A0A176WCY8_MARPO|nr:hypothetical protein AXG93_3522s1140 [Marchantia polymorpha subsp. ruderalis]